MDVPTATSLRDIYDEDALPMETRRWDSLLAKFKNLYGKQAEFVARSPGRVNIIGEVGEAYHEYSYSALTLSSTLTTRCTRCYLWPSPPTSSWL